METCFLTEGACVVFAQFINPDVKLVLLKSLGHMAGTFLYGSQSDRQGSGRTKNTFVLAHTYKISVARTLVFKCLDRPCQILTRWSDFSTLEESICHLRPASC